MFCLKHKESKPFLDDKSKWGNDGTEEIATECVNNLPFVPKQSHTWKYSIYANLTFTEDVYCTLKMLGKHTQKNSLSSKRRTDDNLQQYIQEQIKMRFLTSFPWHLSFWNKNTKLVEWWWSCNKLSLNLCLRSTHFLQYLNNCASFIAILWVLMQHMYDNNTT